MYLLKLTSLLSQSSAPPVGLITLRLMFFGVELQSAFYFLGGGVASCNTTLAEEICRAEWETRWQEAKRALWKGELKNY